MEAQLSDWRAALWLSPQGVSFQLSLSPEEMPRVGVRAGTGLNPEGWTWMGGDSSRATREGQRRVDSLGRWAGDEEGRGQACSGALANSL